MLEEARRGRVLIFGDSQGTEVDNRAQTSSGLPGRSHGSRKSRYLGAGLLSVRPDLVSFQLCDLGQVT